MLDTCANCGARIRETARNLYDDHAELHFCDVQCFHEWAVEDGAEKVIAFYMWMNLT